MSLLVILFGVFRTLSQRYLSLSLSLSLSHYAVNKSDDPSLFSVRCRDDEKKRVRFHVFGLSILKKTWFVWELSFSTFPSPTDALRSCVDILRRIIDYLLPFSLFNMVYEFEYGLFTTSIYLRRNIS